MFKLLKSLVFSLLFVFATNAYSLDRGGSVYKQCRPCHGPQGYGNPKIQAPSIAGLPAWYVEAQLGKSGENVFPARELSCSQI